MMGYVARCLAAFACALPLTAVAADAQPLALAVTPFTVVAGDAPPPASAAGTADALALQLQACLTGSPQVSLLERARIDAVLKEQALGQSGLVDPATAARVGKLLGAQVVVIGRLAPTKAGLSATLRAVSVEGATVVWATEAQGADAAIVARAGQAADALIAALAQAKLAPPPGPMKPLEAVKHHERATGLRAQSPEDAAAEELLALKADPTYAAAEAGFAQALAAAGMPRLAAAEARAELERSPKSPSAAALSDLAGHGGDAPTARAAAPTESPETKALRAIAAWYAQLKAPTAAARLEEARAWIELGKRFVEDGHDRAAVAAFGEALKRRWAAFATDPAALAERPEPAQDACATAAERVIEDLVALRRNGAAIDVMLMKDLHRALDEHQRLPESAREPLAVYELELAPAERVALPESNGVYDLLLRYDLSRVPAGARVVWATCPAVDQGHIGCGHLRQRWVAAEADGVFARAGTPWMDMRRDPEQPLPGALEADIAEGAQPHGFIMCDYFPARPAALPSPADLTVKLGFCCPPGKEPEGMVSDAGTHVARAVYALLRGSRAEARDYLTGLLAKPHDPALDDLAQLCKDAP
jgi:hypothetical protein